MTKPLTFEEYWIQCYKDLPPDNRFHDLFKTSIKNTWNRAMMEATLVCNNKEEEYEEYTFIDKDVIVDIAAEIESLKSI